MSEIDAQQSFITYKRNAQSRSRLALSNHQICATRDVAEVHRQVGRVLCGHNARSITNHVPERFAALHHAPLSATAAIYLQYGVETKVQVEELGFFLLEVPLSGTCETVFGLDRACTPPGGLVMAGPGREFSSHWDDYCSKLLIRIDSLALEKQLGVILSNNPSKALVFELEHPIGREGFFDDAVGAVFLLSRRRNPARPAYSSSHGPHSCSFMSSQDASSSPAG